MMQIQSLKIDDANEKILRAEETWMMALLSKMMRKRHGV